MIGVYDYTVILTYLSMVSGAIGILISMTGVGHPYGGIFFLMLSGLLDGFDGKVARTKQGRTKFEKDFGVQIDSFSDLICFGILPVAIGAAQLRRSGIFIEIMKKDEYGDQFWMLMIILTIGVFYILAALIRLAYFNSTVQMREDEKEKTGHTYYVGLPVTSAALIFPIIHIIHFYTKANLAVFYFMVMLVVAILFVANIKIRKPGKLIFSIMVLIGVGEFIALLTVFI